MKKIIAMVLLGIMVIGTFSPSISYAENVAVETEEELEEMMLEEVESEMSVSSKEQ